MKSMTMVTIAAYFGAGVSAIAIFAALVTAAITGKVLAPAAIIVANILIVSHIDRSYRLISELNSEDAP